MRYLYYCNSAYQILTVLNLHWHRKYAGFENIKDYDADLIVLNSFTDAEEIARKISERNIFHRVILIDKAFNSGKLHAFKTLLDLLSPAFYLKDKYGLEKKDIQNVYAAIAAPKYSTVTAAIWRLNRNAKLHILEDGAGTYFGSLRLTPDSRLNKRFYKTLNYGKTFYDFDAIYVNDKELFTGPQKDRVISIPKYNEENLKTVREIFSDFVDCSDVEGKDVYYFAQFLNNKDINIFIDSLLDYLSNYRKEVLYIPHPRHKDEKTYDLDYANERQIWELKQLNISDLNEKLLISIHSTACFTPKILFDKEPFVLLFYKLCDDKVTTRNDKFDEFIELFKKRYTDQAKIMIPENVDEFKECLERFIEERKK